MQDGIFRRFGQQLLAGDESLRAATSKPAIFETDTFTSIAKGAVAATLAGAVPITVFVPEGYAKKKDEEEAKKKKEEEEKAKDESSKAPADKLGTVSIGGKDINVSTLLLAGGGILLVFYLMKKRRNS